MSAEVATAVTWVAHRESGVLHAVADADVRNADGRASVATLCSPGRGLRLGWFAVSGDGPRCNVCEAAVERTCGTYAGYQHHRKTGEEPCDDCSLANATYMRDYRSTNESVRTRGRNYSMARSRALELLALEHPERFRALLGDQLASLREPEEMP